MRFREAVLYFLGAGGEAPADDYCRACKELGEDDCATCTREIEVMQ